MRPRQVETKQESKMSNKSKDGSGVWAIHYRTGKVFVSHLLYSRTEAEAELKRLPKYAEDVRLRLVAEG